MKKFQNHATATNPKIKKIYFYFYKNSMLITKLKFGYFNYSVPIVLCSLIQYILQFGQFNLLKTNFKSTTQKVTYVKKSKHC